MSSVPRTPTSKGLGRRSLRYAARRTFHGFVKHRGIDSAATLTYFAAIALFPASLVIVSAFALIGGGKQQAVDRITDILAEFLQPTTVDSARPVLQALLNIPNPGLALGIGLLLSVWSVSSFATAFGRAMNTVYEVQEGRQFWRFRGTMILVALVLMVGFALISIMLIATSTVSDAIADAVGIPEPWLLAWDIGKWPVLVVLGFTIIGIIYFFTPNVKHLRLRWVSWGAAFTMIVWSIATAGFAVYVLTVDSYNRVYGWLGGAVAIMLYLYITNFVLVLGAEVDAEIVRIRQLAAGIEAEVDIRLPLRDTKRNLMLANQKVRDEAEGKTIRLLADEERRREDELRAREYEI